MLWKKYTCKTAAQSRIIGYVSLRRSCLYVQQSCHLFSILRLAKRLSHVEEVTSQEGLAGPVLKLARYINRCAVAEKRHSRKKTTKRHRHRS